MKKDYLYSICLAFLFTIVTGCSKETEQDTPPSSLKPTPEQPVPNRVISENMVLAENTFLLTEEFVQHVTEPVTGMEITLNSSISKTDLPQMGQILFYGDVSDKFPFGFLGKVIAVNKTGGQYKILTQAAMLDEAFDKLYINETQSLNFKIEKEDEVQSRIPGLELFEWNLYTHEGYHGIQFKRHLNFSAGLSHDWKLTQGSSIGISGAFTGEMEINYGIGFKLTCNIDIDKKKDKRYAAITLYSHSFQNILSALKGAVNATYELELPPTSLSPNLYPAGALVRILLNPEMKTSFYISYSGELELNYSQQDEQDWMLYFEHKDEKTQAGIKELKSGSNHQEINSFLLDGTIEVGIKFDFDVKLCNQEIISAKASISAGPSITAKFPIPQENENYYDSFKDNTIAMTLLNINPQMEFRAPFICGTDSSGANNVFVSYGLHYGFGNKEYHLFPSFETTQWNTNTQCVTSDVRNDLFVPAKLDYALLDKDRKFMKYICNHPIEYKLEKDFHQPLESEKIEIEDGKAYYVCPVVELPILGKIKAQPEIELKRIKVLTMGDYYEAPALILMGNFDSEEYAPNQFGICYSTTNTVPTLSDQTEYAYMHDEGDFYITIPYAQKSTTYYYRAFITMEDQIYYGDVKSIDIEEPSEEDLKNILGKWERISYDMKAYVPEDDEEEYGRIPHWEIITYMEFSPDYKYAAYYDPIGLLYGYWSMPISRKLNCYVSGTGEGEDDEGHSRFTIKELTNNRLWLQIKVDGLYKMDAVYQKISP